MPRFFERRTLVAAAGGLLGLCLFVLAGPKLYPPDPNLVDLGNTMLPAGPLHPLGTDESGRDVLARLMAGGRVTLLVGLGAGVVALLIGTLVGALSGTGGPWVRAGLSRLLDGALAIPAFFLLIVVITLFPRGTVTLMIAIGGTAWMGVARLVRAESVSLTEREYVTIARALGGGQVRIVRRHLLPHMAPILTAAFSVAVSHAVLAESALSYLGLGVAPPRASWGNMLSGAQAHLLATPWLAIYPGFLIVAFVLACHALAEALRATFDPTLRQV